MEINDNNENLNGFQDLVVTLNKTVTGYLFGSRSGKHEAKILECQNKVTQIATDYIKKEELNHLLKQQQSITSRRLPDSEQISGRGLTLETILTCQVKYNSLFQMARQPSVALHRKVECYVQF